MRFAMTALLAATVLSGCHPGPDGNLNNQPYADQPGGTIVAKPQFIGTDSYDPYATPAPFTDMQYSSVAITPAPTPPLNLSPQGASPMPGAAPGTMPRPRR
jgi:hypothetical protein